MSASNILTVYKTATGQAINGRTRVCGVYFTHGTPQSIKPLVADMKKIYGVEVPVKDL